MILHTFRNISVKKLYGNDLLRRFAKYLISFLFLFLYFYCLHVDYLYHLFMKMLKKHLFKNKTRTDHKPSVRAYNLSGPDVRA